MRGAGGNLVNFDLSLCATPDSFLRFPVKKRSGSRRYCFVNYTSCLMITFIDLLNKRSVSTKAVRRELILRKNEKNSMV